jgi:hypothetical protein
MTSIGSIATIIVNTFPDVSAGISGNMVDIVDNARIEVQNFTGETIGSNSIDEKYKAAITNIARANVYTLTEAESAGTSVSIEGLSYTTSSSTTALGLRQMAYDQLKYLGFGVGYKKVYS